MDRLRVERGISRQIIDSEWIGWRASEGRLTIPYLSPLPGERRRPFQRDRWLPSWARTGDEIKVLAEPGRSRWLYVPRPELLADGRAVLTEGAMDALAAVSADVAAVAAPSGGTVWKLGWTEELAELGVSRVYVPHDVDETGEKFCRQVGWALKPAGLEVLRVDLEAVLA